MPSVSLSLAVTAKVTGVLSCVNALSSAATGGALTLTVIDAVLELPPSLSLTVYEIADVPVKPTSGANVTRPGASRLNVPSPATDKVVCWPGILGSRSTVAASTAPSLSLSFNVTSRVTGVSSCVRVLSSTATGGALMVTLMAAGLEIPPSLSLTVYEIDDIPVKLASGVMVTLPDPSAVNAPSPATTNVLC